MGALKNDLMNQGHLQPQDDDEEPVFCENCGVPIDPVPDLTCRRCREELAEDCQ